MRNAIITGNEMTKQTVSATISPDNGKR